MIKLIIKLIGAPIIKLIMIIVIDIGVTADMDSLSFPSMNFFPKLHQSSYVGILKIILNHHVYFNAFV